jgi:hypothetical protein
MGTTPTLDDDLAGLLEDQAKRRGVTFKIVVNEAIRSDWVQKRTLWRNRRR